MNKKNEILLHHGILGMKWGIRRYQPYAKGEKTKGKFVKSERNKKRNAPEQKQEKPGLSEKQYVDSLRLLRDKLQLEQEIKRLTTAETRKTAQAVDSIKKKMFSASLDGAGIAVKNIVALKLTQAFKGDNKK